MCQPANQDARGRFEHERLVAALLRWEPRGKKTLGLLGDPGPASHCGPVTRLRLRGSSLGHYMLYLATETQRCQGSCSANANIVWKMAYTTVVRWKLAEHWG